MVQRTMVCAWIRSASRCRSDGTYGRSECCAFPYCDVRKAGLPVGSGATVSLDTAVGCVVGICSGVGHDMVWGYGVPVGLEAKVLLGAASAVRFRTVMREGQVCQSVQGRLYLWAQQWAVQCGFVWCSARWCGQARGAFRFS